MDDQDLVAAVRAGDDRAFELLFVRYQSPIAGYVRGMVRDHQRAEDITQEVFIAALRRLRVTDTPIAFKPWIYEIAKNACIDAFRRTRHVHEVSIDADDVLGPQIVAPDAGPDAAVDTKLAIDNLCGAFGGLSQAHHDILVMREFEDLTYREIGERLGMSRAGVESTLFRARRRLSEEYEELVSGERCVRVRGIVDAPATCAIGVRDRRRMARHVAHCQPCRRYALRAGVDLEGFRAPAVARIAALLPLPAFLRRRLDLQDGGSLVGQQSGQAAHWSSVVTTLDPAIVSGWPKAIATAATVAIAGLGAGAAVGERDTVSSLFSGAPAPRVAPERAPEATAGERARPQGTQRPASAPGAQPGNPTATGSDPDAPEATADTDGTTAPREQRPAAAGSPDAEPQARAGETPSAKAPGIVDATLPDRTPPSVDETLGDPPSVPATGGRPRAGLVESVTTTVDGVDTGLPDTPRDVTSTDAVTQGGPAAGTATGSATTDAGAPNAGPLSTVLGQALGTGAGTS